MRLCVVRQGYVCIGLYSDSQASLAALNKLTVNSDTVEKCLNALNELRKKNKVHIRWVKAHVGIHGTQVSPENLTRAQNQN